MRALVWTPVLIATLLFAAPYPASAFDLGLEADASFIYGDGRDTLQDEVQGGRFRALLEIANFGLEAEGGFVEWSGDEGRGIGDFSSDVQAMNFLVAGHFLMRDLGLRVGLGVVIPVADQFLVQSGNLAGSASIESVAGNFGQRDLWLFTPDRLGILIPVHFGVSLAEIVHIEADFTPFILIPTAEDEVLTPSVISDEPALVVGYQAWVQAGIELTLIGPLGIEVGARLSQVFYWQEEADAATTDPNAPRTTRASRTESQLTLDPYVGLVLGPAKVTYRVFFNLDGPNGPSFTDETRYGMMLTAALDVDLL